jgi:hypothetical protein
MTKRKLDLSDAPMAILAFEALKKAVANVIREHKKSGDPIAIWRDGKVIRIPANQIEVREVQAEYNTDKRSKLKKAPKSVTPAKAGVHHAKGGTGCRFSPE